MFNQEYVDKLRAENAALKKEIATANSEVSRVNNLAAKLLGRVELPGHVRAELDTPERAREALEWLANKGPILKPAIPMDGPNKLDESDRAKQAAPTLHAYARG